MCIKLWRTLPKSSALGLSTIGACTRMRMSISGWGTGRGEGRRGRTGDFERTVEAHDVILAIVVVAHLVCAGPPREHVASEHDLAFFRIWGVTLGGLGRLELDGDVTVVLAVVHGHPHAERRRLGDEAGLVRADAVDADPVLARVVHRRAPLDADGLAEVEAKRAVGGGDNGNVVLAGVVGGDVVRGARDYETFPRLLEQDLGILDNLGYPRSSCIWTVRLEPEAIATATTHIWQ